MTQVYIASILCVTRVGERRGAYRVWWGNLRERNHLAGPGVDGRIILKWIFKKSDGSCGLD
jgi:hypothetical protein